MQIPVTPALKAQAPQSPLKSTIEWRFLLATLLPVGALAQVWLDPSGAWLGVLVPWLLIASIDHFFPGAQTSPEPVATNALHLWVVRLHVPLQAALIGSAMWVTGQSDWNTTLGLAVLVGWVSGAQGITFAHELGHSRNRVDRFLAWLLMTSVWYPHFMVEHYRGHHPRAATIDDPATSRRDEHFYRFWLRTVSGGFASAWRLEGQRLDQRKLNWWQSPLLWSFAIILGFASVFIVFGAIKIIAFWLLMSVVAFTLLELVNYIEHYGLQRKTQLSAQGVAINEPFAPQHAWNANHWATNTLLINLQRHSDHHTRAWKPFSTLEDSPPPCPQLPTGYAGSIVLAMIPTLWFRVMNRRLDALAPA